MVDQTSVVAGVLEANIPGLIPIASHALARGILAALAEPPKVELKCECTIETGCGEDEAAGCEFCRASDCYAPCPAFGFMCDPECSDIDGCCTPEQREMARKHRLIEPIAKVIYALNPEKQPWDGDDFLYHEPGAGWRRDLARRQAVAVLGTI